MLYHFSEDATIRHFAPRLHPSHPDKPPAVWAIDDQRAPLYYFPRDCPRIAYYVTERTTEDDRERYFAHTSARMVIAVESGWLDRILTAKLYVYHLPAEPFSCLDQGAGYFTSPEAVTPVKVEPVGDLFAQLAAANVEVRLMPSLFPLQEALLRSSLHFSMIRMRNARD